MTNLVTSPGKFITFEGIDGAGKSSHIEAAAAALRKSGKTVLLSREPGGTALAEKLRNEVLHSAMDGLTELLLVFAARRDHIETVIRPALTRGEWVICDRFTDSTFAYQGGGRQMDLQKIETLERWVQDGLQPDCTLLFDLPPEVAAERRAKVRAADRFEAEDSTGFFERIRQAYLFRAKSNLERFVLVDALKPLNEVRAMVLKAIATL
jgi:dTMP kinase